MKLSLRNWCQGCLALILLWSASTLCAQPGIILSEDRAKTAYVMNFIRLIDWPDHAFADAGAPLIVCVLGGNERYQSLSLLDGRVVNGRLLKVMLKNRPDGTTDCHVAYISRSEEKRLASILHYLDGHAVLTVSSIDGFIDAGGAIGLVHNEEHLEFEVNRETLRKAGLAASSNLLKLARNLRKFDR